jgi:3-oxoacyl-[acyl-carrier protein] reductase
MRQAIVTGGAQGIGAEICAALAAAGYRVGVLDRDAEAAKTRAAGLANAVPLSADVTRPEEIAAAFDAFGAAPDLVVVNAGVVRFGLLADQTLEDFRAVIEVNLIGAYITAREAVGRMVNNGGGHIIGLTSINAYSPAPGAGAYPAAKSGLLQLFRQFAVEYGERGVRANTIAPGFIDGGMSAPIFANPQVREKRSAGVPLKRLGTPADVAAAVVFLDSPGAAYITGQDLVIDGGVTRAVLKNLPRE